MKEYEVIWEIFNHCPRNQMRDVFIEELFLADPGDYVKKKFAGKDIQIDQSEEKDGTLIFDINCQGLRQRMTFTEI